MTARVEPVADLRGAAGQLLSAARTDDQHAIRRQVTPGSERDPRCFQVALAGRIAGVDGLSPRLGFPRGDIAEDVVG